MPHDSSRTANDESFEGNLPEEGCRIESTGGEDFLRWEEARYGKDGKDREKLDPSDEPREPVWFADLLDGRLDAEERRIREASLQENPDLQSRYKAYVRSREVLVALGREESGDVGGPFLRARILAAIQAEGEGDSRSPDSAPAPLRTRGLFTALIASSGVAAAALLGLLYVLGQSPRKEQPRADHLVREDGYLGSRRNEKANAARSPKPEGAGSVAKVAPPAETRSPGAGRSYQGPADGVPTRGRPEVQVGRAGGDDAWTSRGRRRGNADKQTDLPEKKGLVEDRDVENQPAGQKFSGQKTERLAKARKKAPETEKVLDELLDEGKSKVSDTASAVGSEVQAVYRLLVAEQQAAPGAATPYTISRGARSRAGALGKAADPGGQVLIFAVEVDPHQAAALESKLAALESGRYWFSRTRAGLKMPSGGGGGALRSSPARDSRRKDFAGRPASKPETGKAVAGNTGEADDGRGAGTGAVGRAAPKAKSQVEEQERSQDRLAQGGSKSQAGQQRQVDPVQVKSAWGLDSSNLPGGRAFGKMVALADLYGAGVPLNSGNNLRDASDEVLILRGSGTQIQATLKHLFSNSRRQALAYVPVISLSPDQSPRPGLAVPEGLAQSKDDKGDQEEGSRKLARNEVSGEPSGKKSKKRPNEETADEEEEGSGAPANRRRKIPGEKAKPSQTLVKLKEKTPESGEQMFELRLLIRRLRHPVPGGPAPEPPAKPSSKDRK